MAFTQLTSRTYKAERVPRGETPVFEFDLPDNETIVGTKYYYNSDQNFDRKTIDHIIIVWVAVTL